MRRRIAAWRKRLAARRADRKRAAEQKREKDALTFARKPVRRRSIIGMIVDLLLTPFN